jgi:7,8-dihydropterin-6-yl-methyl-4-(beta-D-ribofuranosyl)aminobenzene 5'-phosphate synthase
MGINLIDLNYISFSHGHPDHTWGMTDLFRLFMEAKSGGRNFYLPISGN